MFTLERKIGMRCVIQMNRTRHQPDRIGILKAVKNEYPANERYLVFDDTNGNEFVVLESHIQSLIFIKQKN